jgi:hypothetical protein
MRHLKFLPGLLAVALAGASVYLAQQLASERVRARLAEARVAELQSRLDDLERKRLAGREVAPRVSSVTAASPSAAPPAPKGSQAPGNAGAAPGTPVQAGNSELARMLRSASSRALMRADRIARFKSQYPDLARVLAMTEAEAQDALAFLADQELRESADVAKALQSGSVDLAAVHERQERELAEKLGAERVQKFNAYREGIPDRSQVGSFRARLRENDMLTDAQAASLAAVLQEDREQYAKELEGQFGSNGTTVVQTLYGRLLVTNHSGSDEDAQERQLIEQAETYVRRAHDRAAGLLTMSQLHAFEEFQAAQLANDRVRVRSLRETDPAR